MSEVYHSIEDVERRLAVAVNALNHRFPEGRYAVGKLTVLPDVGELESIWSVEDTISTADKANLEELHREIGKIRSEMPLVRPQIG